MICESRKELCSYLNEYSKQISNERNIELISLLTCSLLDEESLVRRALYILEKDYNEAITLLRLAGDYPYAKYNLVLIENLYKKSKVGFIAKNKVKRAMIKLQKSFLPAYNWLNENYPNKAIKPNDTTKVVEDILFKG